LKHAGFVLLISFSCFIFAEAQEKHALLVNDPIITEFDSLFNSSDSTSLFQLIDSLMAVPPSELVEKSQLALRLGYNSNVVATSRTLGFNQFGLAPGVSYYHKSGTYADATGYWSNEYNPDYYLTALSGGYMKTVGKRWSFLTEYTRYLYSNKGSDVYIPYTNNVGISNFLEFKPLTFRLDYYYYFGKEHAHRIMPGASMNFEIKNWRGVKRIHFFPSMNILFGSATITTYTAETRYYTRPVEIAFRKAHNLPLSYTYYQEHINNEFGVMNYSISSPLSIAYKNWTFLINYTYNFPKALKGEELVVSNSGYLSFSVTKYLTLKKSRIF
jgi:hypothetical protein